MTLGLLAATLLSVVTYFSALSQYSTADQTSTAKRLEAFLTNVKSIQLSEGSLISDLVVAVPGRWLNAALGHFYQLNDPIIGDVHYTAILPFAAIQVVVALAVIAYLAVLIVRLASLSRGRLNAFLLTLLVVMNFPMLKGIAKVLKYDILSTLFAAIAILHYIGYRALGRNGVGVVAVFCGLAYLEKDTSLSITLLICWIELLLIPLFVPAVWAAVYTAVRFAVTFTAIFLVTCCLLVPKIWLNPRQMFSIFDSVPLYLVNIQPSLAVLLVAVLLLAYLGLPELRRRWPALVPLKASALAVTTFFTIVSLAVVALGASAILFQSNILFDPTIAGNDIDVEALRAKSIYVARPIAYSAITTMDHSALLQHLKMFWSMVRAIFYTLPEITLSMIVGAAPLFLVVVRKSPSLRAAHAAPLFLLLLFPVALLAVFSLADLPFEPKYLVLVSLMLTIYGVYPVLLWLDHVRPSVAAAVQATIAALMVLVALSAAPSYLRYKNILRDRAQENAAPLDMNHYIWWTWPGWGETAYPISRYIERNAAGPVTVAFDYWAPFYTAPGQTWVAADFSKCRSMDDLKQRLQELKTQSVDFMIVSKNMSNRQWCLNGILRRMRDKAVFVDTQQGIEYGWLFSFADVVEAFRR
ncbi:MAG: hypothetical protein HY852_05485 [Bradyrhizobium sp.]|uniref:hypothetical protein n=1 Tax=Bradyrhizobium sp. TaxID=376 RepID=UPI0025C60064|nr:hypothetical protein [Bradyrhizobium sp.]MBI5261255.1 hypothetical protein [Bradyrhizobium sp.]